MGCCVCVAHCNNVYNFKFQGEIEFHICPQEKCRRKSEQKSGGFGKGVCTHGRWMIEGARGR